MSRPPLSRVVVLSAALALLLPAAGANCGAENCPLNPQGLESAAGRWSLDLGFQYVDQDRLSSGGHGDDEPGAHVIERFTRTKTWTVNGRAQVFPGLRLIATVPYMQREHGHDLVHVLGPGTVHVASSPHWTYEGVADATMMAQWKAYGSPAAGLGAITIQGGAKLPTGKRHIEEIDGEEPEPPARLGTGSTDALLGLLVVRTLQAPGQGGRQVPMPLAVSVMGRWNGQGTDGYRMGDEVHASVSTGYAIWSRFSVLGQVNVVVHGRDDVGSTDAEAAHTGGTSLFATPGFRADVGAGTAIYGYWQARVYEQSHGQLIAPAHLIVGASYGFGH